jgi:hypothetical protein
MLKTSILTAPRPPFNGRRNELPRLLLKWTFNERWRLCVALRPGSPWPDGEGADGT